MLDATGLPPGNLTKIVIVAEFRLVLVKISFSGSFSGNLNHDI